MQSDPEVRRNLSGAPRVPPRREGSPFRAAGRFEGAPAGLGPASAAFPPCRQLLEALSGQRGQRAHVGTQDGVKPLRRIGFQIRNLNRSKL